MIYYKITNKEINAIYRRCVMKKVLLSLAVVAFMASCGGTETAEPSVLDAVKGAAESAADSLKANAPEIEVVVAAVDSTVETIVESVDSTVEAVVESVDSIAK